MNLFTTPQQAMPGTLLPQQMQQQGMQQALIEALRGAPQSAAPAQQGGVTSAGAITDGLNTDALAGGIKKGIDWLGNGSTARQYGTIPFSQQTNMLALQDAAFK